MDMVPLRECKIPTLSVLPDVVDVAAVVAAGDAAGLLDAMGGLLEQAFSRMLPVAAEPKIRKSRRRNCLVII
jgi:hypothetical protein